MADGPDDITIATTVATAQAMLEVLRRQVHEENLKRASAGRELEDPGDLTTGAMAGAAVALAVFEWDFAPPDLSPIEHGEFFDMTTRGLAALFRAQLEGVAASNPPGRVYMKETPDA